MSLTIINKKPVDQRNPVADTISAAKAHYAKYNRYIKEVHLDKVRWEIFKVHMQRILDGQDIEIRDEIHFRDMIVKKGSKFMLKPYEFILKESTLDNPEYFKNPISFKNADA